MRWSQTEVGKESNLSCEEADPARIGTLQWSTVRIVPARKDLQPWIVWRRNYKPCLTQCQSEVLFQQNTIVFVEDPDVLISGAGEDAGFRWKSDFLMTGSVGVLHYRCVLPTHISWQGMFYTSYRRLAYGGQCGYLFSIEWPCGSFQSLGLQLRSTLGFALCKLLNDKKQVSGIILSPTVSLTVISTQPLPS